LSGFTGWLGLADASVPRSQSTCPGHVPFHVGRPAYLYSMSDQHSEGRFRISPVDCRGRAIASKVLAVAYETSGHQPRNAREQIRDWEFLFWTFLLFGLARLAWLYLYRPENDAFHLGLSCGFVFCGFLGFLMCWVFSPKREK
jgi:hypothetical protein